MREHRTDRHPAGVACHECDVQPERHQGPVIPSWWHFAAREIAEAMLLVGRGLSYRRTAAQLRLNALRYKTDDNGLPVPSRDGGTVARYLDVFGPAILDRVAHDEWPRILLLDALPVRYRSYDEDGNKERGGEFAGAFLIAAGYTEPVPQSLRKQRTRPGEQPKWRFTGPKRHPHLWHIELAGGLDAASWWDFLDRLDGEPEWVVTDGDAAVQAAVRDKWNDRPVLYSCEGHLLMNYQEHAKADGWTPLATDELFGDAFHNVDGWRDFIGRLLDEPPSTVANIAAWVERRSELIVHQMTKRRRGYPRGIGAMEKAIGQLDDWIGDRRKVFQNVRRTNLALGLMRAQIAGHADARLYTRIVRDELLAVGHRPDIDWRKHHDKLGRRGLYALVDRAAERREAYRPVALIAAKNRSVGAKVALANAYRATLGFPPLELNRKAKTVSVKTAGQMLTDRPEILREWDPENERDPRTTRASLEKDAKWICSIDPSHRWPASIGQRCLRLTGCPIHAREIQSAGKGRRRAATS